MSHGRIVRRRAQTVSDNSEQLLRELVEADPASDTLHLRPVALRSVALQRRQALRAYALRNHVDTLLVYAERLAALALIIVVGFVTAREPMSDWLHGSGTLPLPVPQAKLVAAAELPMSPAPAQLSPTGRPSVAKAVAAPATYPELGHALPSSPLARVPFGAEPNDLVAARQTIFSATSKPPTGQLAAVPKPQVAPATPPSWLEIPVIDMDTAVVEMFLQDRAWQVADYAAGYHHGTGLPGAGNVVIAGHKGVRGAVFARLEALAPGHDIFVTAADVRYHYRVRETRRVWPSEVEVMFPTPSPTLTLLTCTNWDLQRFVVVADLVESAPLAEEQASSSTK